MTYDAIIFDNDGVLVEPTDPDVHRDSVREAFREFGVRTVSDETVERLIELRGDHRDQLSVANVRAVCSEFGIDPEEYWHRREMVAAALQLEEIIHDRKALYSDFDAIRSIDLPLGIVSNNQHRTVSHVLEQFGIEGYFDSVYGREPTLEGIERRKPNAYYPERIIEDVGAERPLVVGDSTADVETAKRLGADSVFVWRDHRAGYELSASPDFEISSLDELPAILE